MALVLRRSQEHRPGAWNADDFDVLDDGREVGRIYRLNTATESWWWGVSFQLTGCKSHGTAESRDDAMAALRAEYEWWLKQRG